MSLLNEYDIVNYFFSLDPNKELFNQKLIVRNGSNFYEGNARLNKYLHIMQMMYIALYDEKLYRSIKDTGT